jgi:hypothetical protein
MNLIDVLLALVSIVAAWAITAMVIGAWFAIAVRTAHFFLE